ncbi:hypothetical protein D3C81_1792380 [compost metagenome]
MPLHVFKQLLAAVGANIQITLGHMRCGLQILTSPGITERPETAEQIAAPQAVNHHQQMHRQRQQAVGHRLQYQ